MGNRVSHRGHAIEVASNFIRDATRVAARDNKVDTTGATKPSSELTGLAQQVLNFQPISLTNANSTTNPSILNPAVITELIKFLHSSSQSLTTTDWAEIITQQGRKVIVNVNTNHYSYQRDRLILFVRAAMVTAPVDFLLHPIVTDPAVLALFKKVWYDNTCYVLWSNDLDRINQLYLDLHGGETILLSLAALTMAEQESFLAHRSVILKWLSQVRSGLIGPLGTQGCIDDSAADPSKVYPLLKRLGLVGAGGKVDLKLFLDLLGLPYQASDLIKASFKDSAEVNLGLLRLVTNLAGTSSVTENSDLAKILSYLFQRELVNSVTKPCQSYRCGSDYVSAEQKARIDWFLDHKIQLGDQTLVMVVNSTTFNQAWLERIIANIMAAQLDLLLTVPTTLAVRKLLAQKSLSNLGLSLSAELN